MNHLSINEIISTGPLNSRSLLTFAAVQIVAILFFLGSPVLAGNELMQGMNAYNRHDYKAAQLQLQKAIEAAPEDAVAHYYLGNTLLKLNDKAGAAKQYQASLESAESDDLKASCEGALKGLRTASPAGTEKATTGTLPLTTAPVGNTSSQPAASAGTIPAGMPGGGPGKLPNFVPGGNTPNALGPAAALGQPAPASEQQIKLTPIQQQAEAQKNSFQQQAEQAQSSTLTNASAHAKWVQEQAQRDAENISGRQAAALQAALRQEAAAHASQTLDIARKQAIQTKKMAEEKQRVLDESASNLNDLMNSQVGHSNVHLKPEGTSLYVRNYGQ